MSYKEAKQDFQRLFEGGMGEEEAKTFLSSMYERGESEEEIRAAVETMRSFMLKFETPKEIEELLFDNCGTGGDMSGSFNVSTTVSFLLASLGLYVAKHGNRSVTSKSGSADMLETLGVNIALKDDKGRQDALLESGFVFLFAPLYHPALKHIMPARKALPHRTIFNMLGPLCNPAGVKRHLIGVYDYSIAVKCAKTLMDTGSKAAIVVSSSDGMDEAGISSVSKYAYMKNGALKEEELDPTQYGLKLYPKEAIKGGDAKENAAITISVLKNQADEAKISIVTLNAALALVAAERARDLKEGLEMANYAIKSGKAYESLQKAVNVSQKL